MDILYQKELLRTLVSSNVEEMARWLSVNELTTEEVEWLNGQGLAPYIYFRLRTSKLLAQLAEESRDALQTYYRYGALLEAIQHDEAIATVLTALAEAGVETVILKGMALAHTVYPTPRYRLKGDLDLWIQPQQSSVAIAALQKVGYQSRAKERRPPAFTTLYGGEVQLVSDMPGSGLVEVQWPPIRGEWARLTSLVDHEGIWARRVPFVLEGLQMALSKMIYIMSPEDMLLHLCFHQGISHQFGIPWLRALLDVHLLIKASQLDWEAVVTRSEAWRMTTVVWTVLTLSQRLLGTPIPERIETTLSPTPLRRRLIERLQLERATLEMWTVRFQPRRFPIQLLLTDRPSDALNLLWRAIFPEREWLQARYETGTPLSGVRLWHLRLEHSKQLLTRGKV